MLAMVISLVLARRYSILTNKFKVSLAEIIRPEFISRESLASLIQVYIFGKLTKNDRGITETFRSPQLGNPSFYHHRLVFRAQQSICDHWCNSQCCRGCYSDSADAQGWIQDYVPNHFTLPGIRVGVQQRGTVAGRCLVLQVPGLDQRFSALFLFYSPVSCQSVAARQFSF
ncbi:hypothetical protein BJ742DRAFT_383120 [Cladochytrium replicatum]|nr:hypothetical protein BJ742DRAFT_383120 [Cladochytrium replicatum]